MIPSTTSCLSKKKNKSLASALECRADQAASPEFTMRQRNTEISINALSVLKSKDVSSV